MKVTSKGQVTIPKRVRDRLGIRAGTVLEVEVGAHARESADQLLTRDRGFFRRWFEGLTVRDPSADA